MTLLLRDFKVRQRPVRSGRALPSELPERTKNDIETAEAILAQDFKGVTTNGTPVPGLFSIAKNGFSTNENKTAVDAFLASLSSDQRDATMFPVDSGAWRRWSNIHPFLIRHGVCLDGISIEQRELALGVLKASLSPSGFELARNIMRLNESIREITGSDEELGEWLYWLSVMGQPSPGLAN